AATAPATAAADIVFKTARRSTRFLGIRSSRFSFAGEYRRRRLTQPGKSALTDRAGGHKKKAAPDRAPLGTCFLDRRHPVPVDPAGVGTVVPVRHVARRVARGTF